MTVAGPSSVAEALPLIAQAMLEETQSLDSRVSEAANDVRVFATLLTLNDPNLGAIPWRMWNWQPGLLDLWVNERLVCVLKARQLGVSWLVAAYVLWRALFRQGQRILLVSIGQRDADKLLDKVKFLYDTLPDWIRPPTSLVKSNTRLLRFEALDSEIESLPSTGGVGRSRTASVVVLDEHAHQENDTDIWGAVKPTVEHGQLISISTANGLGPLHTKLYKGAKTGKGGFVPVFIPWHAHPDRDEKWRAGEAEAYQMTANPDLFTQEYPDNDVEAFITTGSAVWKSADIEKQPIETVEPMEQGLWVYREPEVGERYVIGADTSEGLPNSDWCSASVLLITKDEEGYHGEQVAQLRGLWPPEQYAERLHTLATYYAVGYQPRTVPTALLGVERNNHGHAVLLRLRQLNPKDQPYSLTSWKKALGWITDNTTRSLMFDEFAGAIRTDQLTVRDEGTQEQMTTFAIKNGRAEAQSGFHDDDMAAMAIGWQHHRRAFRPMLDATKRER